jgi:ribonucleoside-triphosphate reductase
MDIEDQFQVKYTSGTVFHVFLGEKLSDWRSTASLVRKIAEHYRLPYYTISPTYSVCPDHGYIAGEVWECPVCHKKTEVYSRITGYYRPVQNWNDGKAEEFRERKTYDVLHASEPTVNVAKPKKNKPEMMAKVENILLFTTPTCSELQGGESRVGQGGNLLCRGGCCFPCRSFPFLWDHDRPGTGHSFRPV